MRTRARKTLATNSHWTRSVAAFRCMFRRARALRFWSVGGVSLLVAGVLGLGVQLTVPPTSAIAAQLSGTILLSDVGGTVAGATFNGVANDDRSGISVSSAGDVNGDGLNDFLIGAKFADPGGSARGQSYLIYGQSTGSLLTGTLNLADVGGTLAGATFNGIVTSDRSGNSVSSAGDVNGDGLGDLLIGAYRADPGGSSRGQSYLVYGQSTGSPLTGTLNLSDVGGTLAGATFNGISNFDLSGSSVSGAGDVNGDGWDDLLIGAYRADPGGSSRGQSYLVYGQSTDSPLTGTLNLADVGGTVAGAKFNGNANGDFSGISVSSAGDVNGDGLNDLLIGAKFADPGGSNRGQSYLVYGQPTDSPLTGALNLADVGGTLAGATFNGIATSDRSGNSVSSAGDVNGDGLNDLLIGAYRADPGGSNRGQSYLVYGQPTSSPLTGTLNLADVGGAVAGATFNGIANDDQFGVSVSNAGDVNGDGLNDLVIGAHTADGDGSDRGQSYLVYGQPTGDPLAGTLNLSDVGGTLAGAMFNGIEDFDNSGISVSSAGDVNGDGMNDLVIGAHTADAGGNNRGQSYMVYGQRHAAKWIDPSSDAWDDNLNWLGHEGPGSTDDVLIQPNIGLTVQGPAATATINSLTIGAQTAGAAILELRNGTVNVTGLTTIEQHGKLTGTGIINPLGGISNAGKIDLGTAGLRIAGGTLANTGLVRGSGTIDNALVNSADGEVRVSPGQRLEMTHAGAQENTGRIDVVGTTTQLAEIEFDGELTNAASTGNIVARHAILRFNDGLTNQGTVGISVGTSDIYGDIDNQSGGTIAVKGNSIVTFWDDLTNNGTVEVSSGSTAVYFGTVTGVASFTGSGMTVLEGGLSPGNSPGAMNFVGDVVLGSSSTTLMELAGTDAGQYDQLIARSAQIAGSLNLQPIDGYVSPVVRGESDNFVLVLAGSRVNHFPNVTYDGAALSADFGPDGSGSFRDHVGDGLFRNVTYTPTEVQFNNLLALHGDADGNRTVDITDFEQFLVGFTGPTSDWTTGDFNLDNVVDITDFSINFLPSFAATDGGTYGPGHSIPEPSTLLLIGTGGLMLVCLGWRRDGSPENG